MIPVDVASRLRLATPDLPSAPQPATPARQLTDVLSDLVPGQRLMAEIQALLPNGAYRAIVAQREVTLALPFSAKPGDSLELEVVESDGKVSLAVVAGRAEGKASEAPGQSVPTQLSQTGRLIGDLLAGINADGKKAAPAPLNANQPLIENMPVAAKDLVPTLKDALGKSGMFYEAHQARWVEGKLSTAALLQEPQGKLSPAPREREPGAASSLSPATSNLEEPSPRGGTTPTASSGLPNSASTSGSGKPEQNPTTSPAALQDKSAPNPTSTVVRSELTPIVQQQLDALASQNYVWQGQVWPGQKMHWEIQEEGDGQRRGDDDSPERWQTRLQLTLPNLGGVAASIRLRSGNDIEIALTTDSENGHISLSAAAGALKQQLESSGLNLSAWSLKHGETT